MDGEETKMAPASAGTVDAAALAKAALASVMAKPNGEKVEAAPSVEALQAELAALKAKMGTATPKPPKVSAAKEAKLAAKEAKASAKAAKVAAKAAKKEAKLAAKAEKLVAKKEKQAAKKEKSVAKLKLVPAATEAKTMTVEEAKAFVASFAGKKGRRPASFYEAQKIAGVSTDTAAPKQAKSAAKSDKTAAKAVKLAAKEAKLAAKTEKKAAKLKAKEEAKVAKLAAKAAKAEKKVAKVKDASEKKTPSTGQGGSVIKDLTAEDLNDKETVIMLALGTEGHRTDKTIKELAAECFPNKKKAQANSWTRNGLRRLVRAKFLEKDARGVFKHSLEGRAVAKQLEELKAAKK